MNSVTGFFLRFRVDFQNTISKNSSQSLHLTRVDITVQQPVIMKRNWNGNEQTNNIWKLLQNAIARPVNLSIALAIRNYHEVRTKVRTKQKNSDKFVWHKFLTGKNVHFSVLDYIRSKLYLTPRFCYKTQIFGLSETF